MQLWTGLRQTTASVTNFNNGSRLGTHLAPSACTRMLTRTNVPVQMAVSCRTSSTLRSSRTSAYWSPPTSKGTSNSTRIHALMPASTHTRIHAYTHPHAAAPAHPYYIVLRKHSCMGRWRRTDMSRLTHQSCWSQRAPQSSPMRHAAFCRVACMECVHGACEHACLPTCVPARMCVRLHARIVCMCV